jgi:hypothetical protein
MSLIGRSSSGPGSSSGRWGGAHRGANEEFGEELVGAPRRSSGRRRSSCERERGRREKEDRKKREVGEIWRKKREVGSA